MELPVSLLNHHPGSEGKNDIHLMLCHRKSQEFSSNVMSGGLGHIQELSHLR